MRGTRVLRQVATTHVYVKAVWLGDSQSHNNNVNNVHAI